MKILQVIYSLSSGGAERFITDLANELVKNEDCDITLLILKSDKKLQNLFYRKELSDKIKFYSLGVEHIDLSIFYKLYKYIKSGRHINDTHT